MDRDFYNMHLAFKDSDKFNSCYVGQGIGVYPINWYTPLPEIIKDIYGSEDFFDIIVALPGGSQYDIVYTNNKNATRIIHFHETFNDIAVRILTDYRFDIIIFKSIREMEYYNKTYPNLLANKVVRNFPQIPLTKKFMYNGQDKIHDVLIAGNTSETIYPLRYRICNFIKTYTLPYFRYEHRGDLEVSFEDVMHHNKYLNVQSDQEMEYCNTVLQSKIYICTSSKYGYLLKKYVEAMLAKCLIIGNVPEDYNNILKDVIVDMSKLTDIEIIDTIKYWLDNTEERNIMVQKAYDVALKYFSSNNLVNKNSK